MEVPVGEGAMSLEVSLLQHTFVPLKSEVKKSTDGYVVHRLLGALTDGLLAPM